MNEIKDNKIKGNNTMGSSSEKYDEKRIDAKPMDRKITDGKITDGKITDEKPRCRWCNLKNPLYVAYHDQEWGRFRNDDHYLFEMLILESFQAGLSWECVLNKREAFRKAYDNFDPDKVGGYDDKKKEELAADSGIIRNRLKIKASVENACIFKGIVQEYGSFWNYLNQFVQDRTIYETHQVTNALSDAISKDLKKRGMKFVGSTIIYAYLQAVGVIASHDPECFLYKGNS